MRKTNWEENDMVNKYSKEMMQDMSNRIRKFIKENKRTPNYITATTTTGKTIQIQKPTYAGLFEAQNRFILNNGRYPNYVSEVHTANNPIIMDYQDTTYTCAPASLAMAIQYLYGYESEQKLRTICKTVTGKGTDPQNLVNGAKTIGYKLTIIPRTIQGIKKSIDEYKPIIAHIDTLKETCLGYSKKKNFGHYILIWNIDGTYIKVADPLRGIKTVKASCIINAQYNRKINFYSVEIA